MANPQKENGFIEIANEIVEALYKADLSGQEFRLTLLILRKTYGWKKIDDAVSLSQMCKETGMHHIRCSQVINRLQLMKILTVTENINGIGKKYKFNKDFETWNTVKENINPIRKVKSTVKVFRNPPLRKTASTKETITKETITKEIPAGISEKTFLEYQASRHKKLKPASFDKFFKKLFRLARESNTTTDAIMNQSIENGWEGIFAIKQQGKQYTPVDHRPTPPEYKPEKREDISDEEREKNLKKIASITGGLGRGSP